MDTEYSNAQRSSPKRLTIEGRVWFFRTLPFASAFNTFDLFAVVNPTQVIYHVKADWNFKYTQAAR